MFLNRVNGKCQLKVFLLALVGIFAAGAHADVPQIKLAQPDKWFSIPYVGITQIEAKPDGLTFKNRGTVAYKNSLAFGKLQFELSCETDAQSKEVLLFQFDKERRDSSIHDHHLYGMNKFNRGYGLMFYADKTAAIVKTVGENGREILGKIPEKIDLTTPKMITIRQNCSEERLTIKLSIEGLKSDYTAQDTLEKGYAASGYIGLTVYGGRSQVTLGQIAFEGSEKIINPGQKPNPVYLADFFQEGEQQFVHWRYNEGTSNYDQVRIEDKKDELIDWVTYPKRIWNVPKDFAAKEIQLRSVDIDGNMSEPTDVRLTDQRTEYKTEKPQERIKIVKRGNRAVFCRETSETPFFIKGFNYVRLRYGDHATFEADTPASPAYYDPYDAESLFLEMKKFDYNTVRVFLSGRRIENPGISGYYQNKGLYAPYMENFLDFLRRAQSYGIYVLPTLGDGEIPRNSTYRSILENTVDGQTIEEAVKQSHNAMYFTKQGHQARAKYASDVLQFVKERDPGLLKAFLGLQCQNELAIQGGAWPFDSKTAQITGPDGRVYVMADNTQRQKLFENSIAVYHSVMAKAIRSIDCDMLVAEGIFTPRIAGIDYNGENFGIRTGQNPDKRFPPQASVIISGAIDFVDIHIYYVDKAVDLVRSYQLDLDSTGFTDSNREKIIQNKPFIMGEFGAFKFIDDNPTRAMQDILRTRDLALKDKAQGYMLWTFDTTEQNCLWNAAMLGSDFIKDLAVTN